MAQESEDPGALAGAAGAGQACGDLDVGEVTTNGFDPQASRIGKHQPGEASDGYPALAASDCWRIVRCRGNLQLIIQYRQAGSAKWPWRALAYVVNENLLPGVLKRPSMGIPADHLATLLAEWRAR